MRGAVACVLLVSASLVAIGPASAQRAPTTGVAPSAAPAVTPPPPAPAPAAMAAPAKCANPNALGVSRTVEIDTTGGPGFGFEHFKQHDFLRNNEVILTFDDGPWPTTPAVLKALADECVKAIFFPIGKHATYYPEIIKQVAEAGHTIGSQHLVACRLVAQDRRRGESRDRKGHQRSALGARCAGRAVLSVSPRCAIRRSSSRISASGTWPSGRPTWTRSTSRCASPSR